MRYARRMKAPELILRCYLKPAQGQWVAVCIDLCLAVQADTPQDARAKLDSQIKCYVEEALTVDRAFAASLLTRKAPLYQWIEYGVILAAYKVHLFKDSLRQVFKTSLPVHVGQNC